ncbi:MAG: hypothetical protein EXX96DRAFT_542913 [Benjaminiella poitrasii]|nr:MAG: hypothetical protein EXX96DRAFT_542913 [Benjaminiella poitrasii]
MDLISQEKVLVYLRSDWEEYLKTTIRNKICVEWTFHRNKVKENTVQQRKDIRGREKTVIFSKLYYCHRGLKTYTSQATTASAVQKGTKKIGCKVSVNVVCYMNEPDIVYLERSGEHNNHIPGTYDDLKFMWLSTHIRKNIENVLRRDILRQDARAITEDDFLHNTRDSFIHYDDIYYIYAKIMKELFEFDENDMSSVQKWCDKLENEGCSVLRHQSEHIYYYGFQSEWQKVLMLQSVIVSVDTTHGISNCSRDILYSLVVRNPKTGYGNSVACLITNDHSVEPIKNWLVSFKQRNVMNPSQITVDCSIPEIDAIRVAFGDAWSRNLLTKVKTASTMTDETVKQAVKKTRGLMIAELKTIMYEVDPTAVKQKIESFQNRWIHTQHEFVNYFIDIWVNTFECEN